MDNMGLRKKSKWPLVALVVGILALIAGAVFLIIRLTSGPAVTDGEFLSQAGEWVEEDNTMVIWDFVEPGHGRLTTDGHLNNYNFSWSLENGKLKIETEWLYNLNDEFDYKIDRGAKILTITNADRGIEVSFKAQERTTSPAAVPDATTEEGGEAPIEGEEAPVEGGEAPAETTE